MAARKEFDITQKELKQAENKIGKPLYTQLKDLELTNKQIVFIIDYFLAGCNGTRTLINRAGSANSAEATASAMLSNAIVIKGLRLLFDSWLEEKRIYLENKIIDAFYRRAFYDIATFTNDDWSMKKISEIPVEWRVCVDATEKKHYGKDGNIAVIVVKLPDRDKALAQLAKWLGIIRDKADVDAGLPDDARNNLLNTFNQGRKMREISDEVKGKE